MDGKVDGNSQIACFKQLSCPQQTVPLWLTNR